jgi:hypothetical protein
LTPETPLIETESHIGAEASVAFQIEPESSVQVETCVPQLMIGLLPVLYELNVIR